MNIIALCKTFAGEEWIRPMTLSIYPYVSKIVFVNSDTSWIGRKGNSCREQIRLMKGDPQEIHRARRKGITLPFFIDEQNKIVSLNYDTADQFSQVEYGYRFIQQNFKCDFIMVIDTDEVWDDYDMQEAVKFLKRQPNHAAYRVAMCTYIKSPFWRVDPKEPLEPVCFIRPDMEILGKNARFCSLQSVTITTELKQKIHFHHFVYVRSHFNTILEKILTSHVSENAIYEDMSKWIPEVWNKLPAISQGISGIHPARGFNGNWKGLKEITKEQLPRVLRENDFPIVKEWEKHCA